MRSCYVCMFVPVQARVASTSIAKAQAQTATLARMPHQAQRLVPVQVAVHIIVGRAAPPQDRHHRMPRMVQVTTVRHPRPPASPLVHRVSHLLSRYICNLMNLLYLMLQITFCTGIPSSSFLSINLHNEYVTDVRWKFWFFSLSLLVITPQMALAVGTYSFNSFTFTHGC
jgi:hypothetical protein